MSNAACSSQVLSDKIEWLISRGLRLKEIARAVGVHESTICHWRHHRGRGATLKTAK